MIEFEIQLDEDYLRYTPISDINSKACNLLIDAIRKKKDGLPKKGFATLMVITGKASK